MDIGDIGELLANAPRSRVEERMRSLARPVYVGDNRVLCRILGKLHCYVDGRDSVLAPHLMLDGFWEMWVTQAVARYVKPGMTCIDVGASFGYYTLLLSELVGDKGQVQAFEPDAATVQLLRSSIRLNGFETRARVHPYAVADQEGVGYLNKPESCWSDASMDFLNSPAPVEPGTAEVTVTSLDVMCPGLSEASRQVHFVKIDAEGSELRIWTGMQELLKRCSPVVLMEFGPGFYADSGAVLLHLIMESGYTLRRVSESGVPEKTTPELLMTGELDMLWLEKGTCT